MGGRDDGCGKGGVVPREELFKLDGGDNSRGDKGGVEFGSVPLDHMFCPGKEPIGMALGVGPFTGAAECQE